MDNKDSVKHKCTLKRRLTQPALPPLHPAGKCFPKILHQLKTLCILNENDLRCKTFFRTGSALRIEKRRHARSFWFVIHPFSKLCTFIERLYLLLFLQRWLFYVTIYNRSEWVFFINYIRDVCHGIIMLSFFFTGYIDEKTKYICIHPKKTVEHYFKTYFLIDFYVLMEDNVDPIVDSLVSLLQFYFSWTHASAIFLIIPLSVISIICYIIRFRSILHVIRNATISLGFSKVTTFVVVHGSIFIFVLHFYAFQLYYIPWQVYYYHKQVPDSSWIVQRNLTVMEYSLETYIEGFLIVMSYFLGSGYAEHLTQPCEMLLLFIFAFTGRLYVLTIIGKVLASFGFGNTGESEYECLYLQLDNYMKSMDVPRYLETQIFERFKFSYQKKYFNVQELMGILTDQLRMELFMFGARKLIRENGFLIHLKPPELGFLFSHMKSETYAKQEIIVGGLRERTHTYFILSGCVSAFENDGFELFHLNDGDEFGLLNMASSGSYESFCYVAIETTEVYSVEKKWIKMMLDKYPELVKYFEEIIKERQEKILMAHKFRVGHGEEVSQTLRKGALLEPRKLKNFLLES